MTDVSVICAVVIFRVSYITPVNDDHVSQICFLSGELQLISISFFVVIQKG